MSSTTRIYTIYQILNKVNQKVYIGITTRDNPIDRWNEHLNDYSRLDFILYRAMRKHGIENFEFSVLEQTDSLETLKKLEMRYIQEYNSCGSNGYNMTLGGDGLFGYEHSKETKRKISEANTGKTFSEEHKRKLSEARKNCIQSEETKRKISQSLKGANNPMHGASRSEETKRKISQSKKGKSTGPHSEETKRKMSEAKRGANNPMYGKTISEENKRKISEATKRRIFSEDARRKISEAKKLYWKNKKST